MCYMGVGITESLRALERIEDGEDKMAVREELMNNLMPSGKKLPDGCVACGRCTSVCPERIDIADELAKAAEALDLYSSDRKVFY